MTQQKWTMGANPTSDIWIDHPDVSGHHLCLIVSSAGYRIEDLGSTNGTFINGQRVSTPIDCELSDDIRLADRLRMPWPDLQLAREVFRIGYGKDNDYRITNDDAVSSQHALILIDPHQQLILCDLGSTNGTWVQEERIRGVVLDPNQEFRVGMTSLTAADVMSLRPAARHSDVAAKLAPLTNSSEPAAWVYAAILAGILLIASVGAFVMYRGTPNRFSASESTSIPAKSVIDSEDPKAETSKSKEEPSRAPATKLDENIAVSESIGSGMKSLVTQSKSTTKSDRGDDRPGVAAAASSIANQDTGESLPVSALSRDVRDSLHLVVVKVNDHLFDFATAWQATPEILITNAHVIQSLKEHDYALSVFQARQGLQREVVGMGQLNSFRELSKKINASRMQLAALKQKIEADAQENPNNPLIENLMNEWSTLRNQLPWMEKKADSYDVGWIRVTPVRSESKVGIPLQSKTPTQIGKRVRIYSTGIESDAAYFLEGETRNTDRFDARIDSMIVTDDSNVPLSWAALFDENKSEWKYFLFDGCPVCDLRGQVIGMFRGMHRALAESSSSQLQSKFDLVSVDAISQAIQQAHSHSDFTSPLIGTSE